MPRRTYSSTAISTCASSSCVSSRSSSATRKKARILAINTVTQVNIALLSLRGGRPQHADHHPGDAIPVLGFELELPAACCGDRVELRLAVVVGRAPRRGDPLLLHEPHEAEIDRALIDPQRLLRDLLDAAGNAVAMQRAHGVERLQHHEIERALQ